jgi:hypothetical protein
MLSLEVVGPGGSLSTVLIATRYWRDASWSVLAGGYDDGGIQLRKDNYSARPLAGKWLAVATAERTGFVGDGFPILFFLHYYFAS